MHEHVDHAFLAIDEIHLALARFDQQNLARARPVNLHHSGIAHDIRDVASPLSIRFRFDALSTRVRIQIVCTRRESIKVKVILDHFFSTHLRAGFESDFAT